MTDDRNDHRNAAIPLPPHAHAITVRQQIILIREEAVNDFEMRPTGSLERIPPMHAIQDPR